MSSLLITSWILTSDVTDWVPSLIENAAEWEWQSIRPGVTCLLVPSIIDVPFGTLLFLPISFTFPLTNKMSISFNVPSIPHVQSVVFSIRVVLGSNLRHSHIGIRYWWWLEYILISPAQHQLHHSISVKHYDKNFGAAFAIWDWLFGSLLHSVEFDEIKLGIKSGENNEVHDLKKLYFQPLKEINKNIILNFKKIKRSIVFFIKRKYVNEN